MRSSSKVKPYNIVVEGDDDLSVQLLEKEVRKQAASTTQTTASTGQDTLSIDLSSLANLANGVYIVNIRKGNENIRQKLVKSR